MMAVDSPPRELFCTKCTRKAPLWQPTIDSNHPMVKCVRVDREGDEHGCGVQPGTYDEGEAVAIVRERLRKIADAHHADHVRFKKPHKLCTECRKKAPVKTVEPHEFAAFPRKYRTAAHLELVHHDRGMLPRLPLRSAAELEDYHRGLHTLGGAR